MPEATEIKDRESFSGLWDDMKKQAYEIFNKDGYHTHVVFLITSKGLMAVLYEQVAQQLFPDKEAQKVHPDDQKEAVFKAVANVAYQVKARGYIEIGEGYGMMSTPDSDTEKTLEAFRKVKESYGFIKNMPNRVEMLFLRARFREFSAFHNRKIMRRDKEVWLESLGPEQPEEIQAYQKEDFSRGGMIDHAIDKVIEEEK